ncbi:MAG: hypothetical protein FJX72_09465 [Armatimonadetes bacterium]|nr:hypothetical protein [Armatimonadota bacterium]
MRASRALVFGRSGTARPLSHDYEGQLTQITQGQNTTDLVYDALGRRYSRTAGGTTTVFYSAGSQVLLEKQGDTFTGVYTYGNSLLRRNSEVPALRRPRFRAHRHQRLGDRRAFHVIAGGSTGQSSGYRDKKQSAPPPVAPASPTGLRGFSGAQRSNPDHLGANRSGLPRRSAPRNDVWAFGHTSGTTGSSLSGPFMYAGTVVRVARDRASVRGGRSYTCCSFR